MFAFTRSIFIELYSISMRLFCFSMNALCYLWNYYTFGLRFLGLVVRISALSFLSWSMDAQIELPSFSITFSLSLGALIVFISYAALDLRRFISSVYISNINHKICWHEQIHIICLIWIRIYRSYKINFIFQNYSHAQIKVNHYNPAYLITFPRIKVVSKRGC